MYTLTQPLPRVIRFVPTEAFGGVPGVLATLNERWNVLYVNKELYDELRPLDRDRCVKTGERTLFVDRF